MSSWRPLIGTQRDRAERYLIVTIMAFVLTVAATRWYLELAGYPTVGGGELHVAHALWGGLALVIAALLPLLWVGQRSLMLSAVLAGIGVGLFIDEVGKFLTTSNDYFFAPAAPLIYGSILLLVLLALLVRHRRPDDAAATHAILEALRDAADGRLTEADRERVAELSREATEDAGAGHDDLRAQLLATLESSSVDSRLAAGGPIARGDARRWLERIVPARLERWVLYFGLALSVVSAIGATFSLVALNYEPDFFDASLVDAGRMQLPDDPIWVVLLFAVNVAVGVSAVVSLGLRIRGSDRWLDAALVAVLIDLVVGELVAFYAIQFLALTSAFWSLLLLGITIDLRIRAREAVVDDGTTRT